MEKRVVITIAVLTILFNIFFFLHIGNSTVNSFLTDKITVSFKIHKETAHVNSKNEILKKVQDFFEENNVEIAQYNFLTRDKIDIYSTNKDKYKELLFIPNFIFNRDIKVHDFDELLDVGFKNLLYVDTDNQDIIKSLSEILKDDCKVYYVKSALESNNFSFNHFFRYGNNNSFPVFAFFIFVCILLIFFYYSVNRKKYFIYKLWGYSDAWIYYILNKPLFISLLSTAIFSNLVIAIAVYKNILSRIMLEVFFNMLILNIVSVLLIFILSIPLFKLFCVVTNTGRKKGLIKIIGISYVARVLLFSLIVLSYEQFFDKNMELKEKLENLSVWEDTKNLYNIYESYSPYYADNLAAEDVLNYKMLEVYKELSDLGKVFIIKTINFEHLKIEKPSKKKQKEIEYVYKLDVKNQEDLYSPYGKSIVVDKNYLKKHTIKSLEGENVIDLIDNSADVWNVLVPEKFKDYEASIENSYKEWFYFQKVEVTNMYKEAEGKSKVVKNIEDLKVNIIYIGNNQNIFTYNSHSGDGFNFIEDTIISVYTENVDNSFLASCFGDYIFMESKDEYSALKEISAITQKYNVIELNNVGSVYDKRGEEIKDIEADINNLILNTVVMYLFLLMFMIVIIYAYYKSSFSTITIKSLYGYGFWQIYKRFILGNLFINLAILLLMGFIYKKISLYMFIIIVLMSIVDYFLSKIVSTFLIVKGELKLIRSEY